MRISQKLVEEIMKLGRSEAPIEACGYLVGRDRTVFGILPMRNVDASPVHFSFDPREQFAALKHARSQGQELLGTYHTHPESPARMSEEDKRLAADPSALYVILSLVDEQIRCFRRETDGEFAEDNLEIIPSERGLYLLPDSLSDDIERYAQLVDGYLKGSVDPVRMKTERVPMGVYEQREDGRYMMRLRLPGGDITPDQLERVVEIARDNQAGTLHITTRQDLQLHDLELIKTPQMMRDFAGIGLSSRGGGGNTVRNIVGSWDSGFARDEVFDVTPYVRALTNRMISESDSWTLPRKFKIAFSSDENDTACASMTDLGFIAARDKDGSNGFIVFAGGGTGSHPSTGIRLFDFVPASDVYVVAAAGKRLFDRFGNRKDRTAARLRFLLFNWGDGRFREEFASVLREIRAEAPEPLDLLPVASHLKGFAEIPILLGDLSYDAAIQLSGVARHFGPDSLRFTPRQNIVIRNIPLQLVASVRNTLKGYGLLKSRETFFSNVVACAGASTCRLGICLSRGLVKALRDADHTTDRQLVNDLKVNVSGCPNSCGQHLLADVGFYGGAMRQDGRQLPAYTVVVGGRAGLNPKLADPLGRLPAYNVPSFFNELLDLTARDRLADESYGEFFYRKRDELRALLEKHTAVPSLADTPEALRDWGATVPFTVLRKQGECAAGVVDLIRRDFENAQKALDTHASSGNETLLREAVESAANALLITRGLESESPSGAVRLFVDQFAAQAGLDSAVPQVYLEGEPLAHEGVAQFLSAVKAAYDAMDSTLGHVASARSIAPPPVHVPSAERDLRGVACPMNFVKTKLALETINDGDVLKVLLDDGPPIENVPASVSAEGHEVLERSRQEQHWTVLIRKKGSV